MTTNNVCAKVGLVIPGARLTSKILLEIVIVRFLRNKKGNAVFHALGKIPSVMQKLKVDVRG